MGYGRVQRVAFLKPVLLARVAANWQNYSFSSLAYFGKFPREVSFFFPAVSPQIGPVPGKSHFATFIYLHVGNDSNENGAYLTPHSTRCTTYYNQRAPFLCSLLLPEMRRNEYALEPT